MCRTASSRKFPKGPPAFSRLAPELQGSKQVCEYRDQTVALVGVRYRDDELLAETYETART